MLQRSKCLKRKYFNKVLKAPGSWSTYTTKVESNTWHSYSLSLSPDQGINVHLVQRMSRGVDLNPPTCTVWIFPCRLNQIQELTRCIDPDTQNEGNFEQNCLKAANTWKLRWIKSTVTIWIHGKSGIQMVQTTLVVKWSKYWNGGLKTRQKGLFYFKKCLVLEWSA